MRKLLRFSFLVASLAILAGDLHAQYESSGPNGGAVYSFYRDNTGSIYAAGSGGVYVSSNEGVSWQEASGSPTVFGCDALYSVASFGNNIFAGSQQSGIFRSADGGNSWQASGSGLRIGPGAPYADVEIAGPNLLAIRPDSGFLFVSTDMGASWARHNLAIANAIARYLSVHNNNVYVSTLQGLFSSPNGLNFTNINPSPADFGELIWVNDTAYVATATGIKMSLDGGVTFATIALAGRAVRKVAVTGNNIYAVVRNPAPVQDSVLYSTNGGLSFIAAPFSARFRFTTIHAICATPNGLLVGSDYGLYSTVNSGTSWNLADSGYHATKARGLATSGAYVFAGASPMGVFRVKPDSGVLRWQHSGDVSQNVEGNINAIAARGAFVHAGGATNYYRSSDSGATWTAGATGASTGNVTSVYASPATSDVWIIRNGNLYYSSDDGGSFGQVVNSNIPLNQSLFVTRADTATFVATFFGLYKGGTTMSFASTTGIAGRVTAVVFAKNAFYAASDGSGLFTSPNGSVWTAVNPAPGSLPAKINILLVDSANNLIAGTDNGFYSNAGGTWAQSGLADHAVLSLTMRAGKLFVGTCSGVYSIPYKILPPVTSVGTDGHLTAGMELFPNPASGSFSVRVNASHSGPAELMVKNTVGASILRRSMALNQGINELHISVKDAFSPGLYLVQIVGADFRITERLLLR